MNIMPFYGINEIRINATIQKSKQKLDVLCGRGPGFSTCVVAYSRSTFYESCDIESVDKFNEPQNLD